MGPACLVSLVQRSDKYLSGPCLQIMTLLETRELSAEVLSRAYGQVEIWLHGFPGHHDPEPSFLEKLQVILTCARG